MENNKEYTTKIELAPSVSEMITKIMDEVSKLDVAIKTLQEKLNIIVGTILGQTNIDPTTVESIKFNDLYTEINLNLKNEAAD